MNLFKTFHAKAASSLPPSRELSQAELIAVSGGMGQMNPIHAPSPHPIVYVPIINPFPFRRLPG